MKFFLLDADATPLRSVVHPTKMSVNKGGNFINGIALSKFCIVKFMYVKESEKMLNSLIFHAIS